MNESTNLPHQSLPPLPLQLPPLQPQRETPPLNSKKVRLNSQPVVSEKKKITNTSTTVKTGPFRKVVRGPFFLIAFVLVFISCSLVFISLFTNNWQKTAPGLVDGQSFTYGIWFTCRNLRISWSAASYFNIYCSTTEYNLMPWIYAVQVFYTLGAALILIALAVSLLGVCRDCAMNKLGMPSFLFWIVLVSSIFQLVGIVVYGARGIGNYSQFVPDYSIIIASIGLGFSVVSAIMFVIEILTYAKFEMRPSSPLPWSTTPTYSRRSKQRFNIS